jgi:polyphosphate kinase
MKLVYGKSRLTGSPPDPPTHDTEKDINKYLHRELSWLEFNRRALEEAKDETVPLLERVKFLVIFSSNLDEFFMVRVPRIKRQVKKGLRSVALDGLTPAETLSAISKRGPRTR